MTVFDLDVNDIVTVKAKIEETIISYFLGRDPYIDGLTVGARRDRIAQTAVAGVVEDVVTAFNGTFSNASVKFNGGATVAIYSLGEGEKAKSVDVLYS